MSEKSSSALGLAGRSWQAWTRFLLPVALGLAADLYVKSISFPDGVMSLEGDAFSRQGQLPFDIKTLIPNVLGFQTTVNAGAVFGFGQGWVAMFVIFSLIAISTIGFVFARSKRNQIFLHIALGLILAGALGNLYDRIMFHGVRDMLLFTSKWSSGKLIYPFIFNVADVLLCVGVPLLMICWLFPEKPAVAATDSAPSSPEPAGKLAS